MTPGELAAVMVERGKPATVPMIRYHCRDPRGLLYGKARLVGRSWEIPPAVAEAFAEDWQPYQSRGRKAA